MTSNRYIIPIKGLSQGKHSYQFIIDDAFFKEYDESLISSADLTVNVVLNRQTTFIEIEGEFFGKVKSDCDRCLGELDIELDFNASVVVKFNSEIESEEDSEIIFLSPSESELDLSQYFYDYISLALPLQKTHSPGECDPQMIEKLNNLTLGGESPNKSTSPFDKLKDLINKQ